MGDYNRYFLIGLLRGCQRLIGKRLLEVLENVNCLIHVIGMDLLYEFGEQEEVTLFCYKRNLQAVFLQCFTTFISYLLSPYNAPVPRH